MAKDKLILVHAPTVYDFRKRAALSGPIGDLVPSTTIFEMYPIGFTTIAEHLERHGHRVRLVNLAVRMLRDHDFDAEKLLASLNPLLFGIDLHWLPHAHGAIEVARLLKKYHPQTPIIFGGISSSYYHRELINYADVDYVMRGDSTEEPLRQLVECLDAGARPRDLAQIPNLTWRDASGVAQVNPLSHVPTDLDYMLLDYSYVVNAVARERNLLNYLPFAKWTRYPITAALTCRGCTRNCAICGGSAFAYRHIMNRPQVAYRSPEVLAQDLRRVQRFSKGPVFVLGDIRQAGIDYARRFLRAMQGFKEQVIIEFFSPVDRAFMEEVAAAIPNFVVEVSPDSHDAAVCQAAGKPFDEDSITTTVEAILGVGVKRLDLFFMAGLPSQTPQSVLETIDYTRRLLARVDGDKRFLPFISPLAPFLDPGSLAFEKADQYGYKLLCRTVEDHRQASLAPSWKYMLSYESRTMSRAELVNVTYEAGLRLNRLKAEFGLVDGDQAKVTEARIHQATDLMARIDHLVERYEGKQLEQQLLPIRAEIEAVNSSTVCEKKELDLPVGRLPIKVFQAAGVVLEQSWHNLKRRLGLAGQPATHVPEQEKDTN